MRVLALCDYHLCRPLLVFRRSPRSLLRVVDIKELSFSYDMIITSVENKSVRENTYWTKQRVIACSDDKQDFEMDGGGSKRPFYSHALF